MDIFISSFKKVYSWVLFLKISIGESIFLKLLVSKRYVLVISNPFVKKRLRRKTLPGEFLARQQ